MYGEAEKTGDTGTWPGMNLISQKLNELQAAIKIRGNR
jgi:hypothetical protein